jgi:hypothetical protein
VVYKTSLPVITIFPVPTLLCVCFFSQQDIENFKAEIEKRQLKDVSPALSEEKTDSDLTAISETKKLTEQSS